MGLCLLFRGVPQACAVQEPSLTEWLELIHKSNITLGSVMSYKYHHWLKRTLLIFSGTALTVVRYDLIRGVRHQQRWLCWFKEGKHDSCWWNVVGHSVSSPLHPGPMGTCCSQLDGLHRAIFRDYKGSVGLLRLGCFGNNWVWLLVQHTGSSSSSTSLFLNGTWLSSYADGVRSYLSSFISFGAFTSKNMELWVLFSSQCCPAEVTVHSVVVWSETSTLVVCRGWFWRMSDAHPLPPSTNITHPSSWRLECSDEPAACFMCSYFIFRTMQVKLMTGPLC